MSDHELDIFAAECIASLDEDKREVIRSYYGLGVPAENLESIAVRSGITRQGAHNRQVRALEKLARLFSQRAANLIEEHADFVWQHAQDGKVFAKSPRPKDPMSGAYQLAWHVTTGNARKFDDWLGMNAIQYETCWIDRRLEGVDDEVRRVQAAASSLLISLGLPWAAEAIAGQLDCSVDRLLPLLMAAFPQHRWNHYSGYIFHGRSTPRPRRAIRLHIVLKYDADRVVTGIREAGDVYRTRVPSDQCSDRDLLIVARNNKHLFLEVGSANLSPIGIAAPDNLAFQAVPAHEDEDASEAGPEKAVKAGAESSRLTQISNLLLKEGPLRLSTIMERLPLSAGTISGTIGQNYQFVRVLPGTYALESQIPEIDLSQQEQADALFNESEVLRIYIRARHAGEPFEIFPLWDWEFEYRLALWTERNASPQLPALLSVIEPQQWPAPKLVIDTWLDMKKEQAEYQVAPSPEFSAKYATPKKLEARHVLAALLLAKDRGRLSVVSCSMVLGADGLDSSVGCILLMLLVAAGCAELGETWQSPHNRTARADRWSARLSEDLANHGELDWSSASARAFLAEAGNWKGDPSSWFDHADLSQLVSRLEDPRAKSAIGSPAPVVVQEAPSLRDDSVPVADTYTESDVGNGDIITTEQLRNMAHGRNSDAMFQLALRTRVGDGTPLNNTMAIYWLRRAAACGHAQAQAEIEALPAIPSPQVATRQGKSKASAR